jgi:predicted lipoprotein
LDFRDVLSQDKAMYKTRNKPVRWLTFRTAAIWLLGLALLLILSGCSAFFTVVPIQEANIEQPKGSASNKGFDKVAYVDGIWQSKVLPTVQQNAVDFSQLYDELKLNQDAASQKYGKKVGGPYNFLTKFEGKVLSADTSSRVGVIKVETQTQTGAAILTVQVGPVVQGTSIRDALGFIAFNDFVNQLQFADVADELNTRALKNALNDTDPTTLVGKTVDIIGAFTLDNIDDLVITPVFMTMK